MVLAINRKLLKIINSDFFLFQKTSVEITKLKQKYFAEKE